MNQFFFGNLRQGTVGDREQKVGSSVRQEKAPRAVVSTKDNADMGASVQVTFHLCFFSTALISIPFLSHFVV